MKRLTERKLVLIIRETRLDELIFRFNTLDQARFYVEHLGADFSDYLVEDQNYKSSIGKVEKTLRKFGRLHVLHRKYLPNYIFGNDDVIIVLGQDGLLANTLKYLQEHPVIGINPDPERWGGELLPFKVKDLGGILPDILADKRDSASITLAKATLDNGQSMYAVNDLFIGAKTHVSAKYMISIHGTSEYQSSSGVIVSTGLGSTGWLKSIIAGASGIASAVFDQKFDLTKQSRMPWNAKHLYFSVREPFPSKKTSATIVYGQITPSNSLTLLSQMSGNGVIFSDGIENDFLEFNSGMTATVSVAEKSGRVII
jgi:NAD kinase